MADESPCPGRLVVHVGGRIAFCTEESEGRPCPGHEVAHSGPPDPCWLTVAGAACAVCDEASNGSVT